MSARNASQTSTPARNSSPQTALVSKTSHKARREFKSNIITYAMVIAAYAVVQLLVTNGYIGSALQGQLIPICCYIAMAVSLNLVVGLSGELSLGHAGFMSVGAFSGIVVSAYLANFISNTFLLLVVSMLIGGVFAGIAGLVVGVPVMRLRGDYLAIVTLAFGEIIKTLLNNMYVGVNASGIYISFTSEAALAMESGRTIIKGPQGAVGITRISTFFVGFLLVLFALFVVQNLKHSRSGRAIMAIRDNRIAAESVGVNTTKYRLIAFVVAAAIAGMAGALYAQSYSSIAPKRFGFDTSILIVVYVVLGGMGNIRGSVISATVLTILPEALRALDTYRMFIYAIVLIVVMLITNNQTLRDVVQRIKGVLRQPPNRSVSNPQALNPQTAHIEGSQDKGGDGSAS